VNERRNAGGGIREVTSAANPLLKVFRRALAEGTARGGWLAVEGPHLVEEALRAAERAAVQSVIVAAGARQEFRGLLARLPSQAEVTQVPDRLFRQIAATESPQGIAALVELHRASFSDSIMRPDALVVVACGLQDPGNLGTIVRSAQALGATALITLEATVSPFNPKALRASAGAVFQLPVFAGQKTRALFRRLHEAGLHIIAADRRSPSKLSDADLRGPVALLIGMEAAGLAPEIAAEADMLLSIPIRPGMDSVNAATAASIFLYEVARQRGFKY
jgi:TrmH family RNA methyltransferase